MRVCLIILGLLVSVTMLGQYKGPKFPINDKWFWTYGAKGLQVGDKIPSDILLGSAFNDKNGKTKLSQFKNKLVILDFWATTCTNCIAGFPKMEKLQKEFGDQIQIILVNIWETEQQIKERMAERYGKEYRLPDLPSMVSKRPYADVRNFDRDTPLIARYFPMKGVPHHVWIDAKGVIRLRGGSENTYDSKITELLSGKPIQLIENWATLPDLFQDRTALYYQQLGFMQHTPVSYGSFITPYTNEVTGAYGAVRESIDSGSNTRIISYMNESLLNLYFRCFAGDKSLQKYNTRFLFSPSEYTAYDFLQFPAGMDRSLYSSDSWFFQGPLTTEEIIRSKYCYEQIVPLNISEEERKNWMLEDLNRYFKVHYGIVGAVQKKRAAYYELISTSEQDKVTIRSSEPAFQSEVKQQDGQLVLDYKGSLNNFFISWLRNKHLKIAKAVFYDSTNHSYPIYNGTKWDRKQLVSMQIPLKDLHSIVDVRQLLQAYGLDLVERYDDLPFYVFTRVNEQSSNDY